jgi:hypothetical protein
MKSMSLSLYLRNEKILFSIMAFSVVLIVLNLVTIKSALIGTVGSILYFLIGGNFVGVHLLGEEQPLVRVSLGALVLLSLMGLMGWLFIIFRGLGVMETAVVLAAALSFVVFARYLGSKGLKGKDRK